MRTSKLSSLMAVAALTCSCGCQSPSGVPAHHTPPQLPPQIQEVKVLLQGKPRDAIRQVMIEHFGPVQRYGGRGIRIDLWDIAGGELALNPAVGPTFTPKGQDRIWLLTTHNPVRTNLLGSYEMVSLPADPSGSGRCWLGNLQIEPDLSYSYKDSGQFPEKSAQQTNNFFYLHLGGAVEIQYADGVTDDTLLEALPTGSIVAWLHFRSGDGNASQTYTITTQVPARRLVFGASTPLSFEMDKWWESCWE
jgi:hypothetical protein